MKMCIASIIIHTCHCAILLVIVSAPLLEDDAWWNYLGSTKDVLWMYKIIYHHIRWTPRVKHKNSPVPFPLLSFPAPNPNPQLSVPFPCHSRSCHSWSCSASETFIAAPIPIPQKLLLITLNNPLFYTLIWHWHNMPKTLKTFWMSKIWSKYNWKHKYKSWTKMDAPRDRQYAIIPVQWNDSTAYAKSRRITAVVSPASGIPAAQKAVVVTVPTVFYQCNTKIKLKSKSRK